MCGPCHKKDSKERETQKSKCITHNVEKEQETKEKTGQDKARTTTKHTI
jgi:hypothetical protein